MYSRFLHVRLPVFVVSGLILALLAGANILLHRKTAEVRTRIDDMSRISRNRSIIRKETDLLKKQIDRVNAYLPPDKGKDAYREVLLSGLDNIRSRVDAAHVAFSNIEGHAEPRLPLVVSFDYSDYFQLVKLLDQLEGVRFPFFSFKSFSFQKTSTGTAECEVTGSLVTQRGDP